ncbi:relaxase/mobilization nuclease domain-containing protein [Aliikangiella sp. IMCC44359]|uniref:relaxase/mobilization nuclease domain-containing protein n=1 Tax=Aliikangiella sp. IMCC44359 TaxID=3459125 RepID=UPI00403AA3A4
MILKGSQRGGARQMALHLMNEHENDHVTVHEVSGFLSDNIMGALNEVYAYSKGTKCRKFMYSLSLNPPENENVSTSSFEEAIEKAEKRLGLENQPRVIVFHEKEGRRHAHCVWSRIDTDEMKAINIAHDKLKLNDISKNLFLEHGWKLPHGFIDKSQKNPLSFTREEWQQAMRTDRKPQDIRRELQESWCISDCRKSFENALNERGYKLAKGDKRNVVLAVDIYGDVHKLRTKLGIKQKELTDRIGQTKNLTSVADVQKKIASERSSLFNKYNSELSKKHQKQKRPLLREKDTMKYAHRNERAELKTFQENRWLSEEKKRSARVRSGFKGLWDKLTGHYWKTRKRNEIEAWNSYKRDQQQRDELIQKQLQERQTLQTKIKTLDEEQILERQSLVRDLSYIKYMKSKKSKTRSKQKSKDQENALDFNGFEIDNDFEPDF